MTSFLRPLVLCLLAAHPLAVARGQNDQPAQQFDFWRGEWEVVNRFLQEDGSWSTEGTARNQVFSILDGKAVLELWDGTIQRGFRLVGFSVRYYNAESERWSLILNWPMPDSPRFFELEGRFRHGRGEFFRTREDSTGAEVLVRYTFSDVKSSSFRWDTAWSRDGGVTWRTTWIMEFVRRAERADWPGPGEDVLTYTDGTRCTASEAERFDDLEGRWEGTVQRKVGESWEDGAASVVSRRILDGCAVLDFEEFEFDDSTFREMRLRAFNPASGEWETLILDSRPGSEHRYATGLWHDGTFVPQGSGNRWLRLDSQHAEYDKVSEKGVTHRVRLVRP